MLDKEVFKSKIKELSLAFRNWKFDITDKELISFWYKQFKNYGNEEFKNLIQKYIDNESYSPTIAGIKNNSNEPDKVTANKIKQRKKEQLKRAEKYG